MCETDERLKAHTKLVESLRYASDEWSNDMDLPPEESLFAAAANALDTLQRENARLKAPLTDQGSEVDSLFSCCMEPYEGPSGDEVIEWFNAVIAHRLEAESK